MRGFSFDLHSSVGAEPTVPRWDRTRAQTSQLNAPLASSRYSRFQMAAEQRRSGGLNGLADLGSKLLVLDILAPLTHGCMPVPEIVAAAERSIV